VEKAAEKSIPIRHPSKASKPWWNEDLSKAYRELRQTRESLKGWVKDFNRPSVYLADKVKSLHKDIQSRIRKAKQEYYCKLTEEANPGNMWDFRKWTKCQRTYISPPIINGMGQPAVNHKEKCNILHETLFPQPPTLPNAPAINLTPCNDDMEYVSMTKNEVRDAIFTAAQLNAPGISGLTGRAWRWAWQTMENEIFHLLRLCADSGYHPKVWRTSIAVALQKPNRDYTLPRSYRLIQLLEVSGKALERVQARRLAFIAAKHQLFLNTQYGGLPGRSAP
jgi:hypothetical protein